MVRMAWRMWTIFSNISQDTCGCGGIQQRATLYSSDRNLAAEFVTFTPRTFALRKSEVFHTSEELLDAPLKYRSAVSAGNTMGNFCGEGFVVH